MFLNITAANFTGESPMPSSRRPGQGAALPLPSHFEVPHPFQPPPSFQGPQLPFQHLQRTDDHPGTAPGQLPGSWPLQQNISLPAFNDNTVTYNDNSMVGPWIPLAPPTAPPAPLRPQDNSTTTPVASQTSQRLGEKENIDVFTSSPRPARSLGEKENLDAFTSSPRPAQSLGGWAARNPDLDIIPSRQHVQQRGCKVVNDVKRQVNKDARIAFNTAVSEVAMEIEQQITKLAQDHAKTEASVREALVSATHYSQHREPSLQNAKVHDKAQEINKGRAKGEKLKMIEVRAMMDDDPKYKNLNKEEEAELIQSLRNFREKKDLAARASNKAAAADISATIRQIARELLGLYNRTGTVSVALFCRSDVDSSMTPTMAQSGGEPARFFKDVMLRDPEDVARLFDSWAVTTYANAAPVDTRTALRTEISELIKLGLGYITNNKCKKMQYEQFDIAIKLQYGVDLAGFPGELRNPAKIGNVADLQVIRDKLKTGACKWVKMSRVDRMMWAEKMQGKGGRQRAVRSDVGTKRPRKRVAKNRQDTTSDCNNDGDIHDADGDDGEHADTSKKGRERSGAEGKRRRVERALPPVFKSAEFVASDDDSE